MSVLCDRSIRLYQGVEFEVTPWDSERVQPASLDVCFGNKVLLPRVRGGDLTWFERVIGNDDFFILGRGEFALAQTLERVTLGSRVGAQLAGRSSWGRLGLGIHITAGWIDPGFDGHITLELHNVGPVPLHIRPGDSIGQLILHLLDETCERPYAGRYNGAEGVQAPRGGRGFGHRQGSRDA